MDIGEQKRVIIVEPLTLPAGFPPPEPVPVPDQIPELEPEPALPR